MRNRNGSYEYGGMSSDYRYGADREEVYRMPGTVSVKTYNLILGLTLFWGFAVNAVLCLVLGDAVLSWNPIAFLIGYFVCATVGVVVCHRSHNAVASFIGYNLVVLPLGLALSVIVSQYELISVASVFLAAAAITLTMMLLGMVFPRFFFSVAPALGVALLLSIVVEFILLLINGNMFGNVLDFVVAGIFCGYIGYDWAIAQRKEFTPDNAVDSACDLYLDIVNLFIRLLSIFGKRKR